MQIVGRRAEAVQEGCVRERRYNFALVAFAYPLQVSAGVCGNLFEAAALRSGRRCLL
jgi:hypothetical protein